MSISRIKTASLAIVSLVTLSIKPCVITITNDSDEEVLLVADDKSHASVIKKNQTKTFGDPEKHANFYVMAKVKESKDKKNLEIKQHMYAPRFIVRQIACADKNKEVLFFSTNDIANNNLNKDFFTVTAYEETATTPNH